MPCYSCSVIAFELPLIIQTVDELFSYLLMRCWPKVEWF